MDNLTCITTINNPLLTIFSHLDFSNACGKIQDFRYSLKGRGIILVVKRLLPPQTSRVSRRILNDSDTRNVQIDEIFSLAPQEERWQIGSNWSTGCCKTRNVSLQRCGDSFVSHGMVRAAKGGIVEAAKEGVVEVVRMKRWWDAELIGVCFVLECSVEVVVEAAEFWSGLFSASRPCSMLLTYWKITSVIACAERPIRSV